MNNQWLTIPEAMAYLRISSRTTLYRIMTHYPVRRSKILSLIYISREDLDNLLYQNVVL